MVRLLFVLVAAVASLVVLGLGGAASLGVETGSDIILLGAALAGMALVCALDGCATERSF